MDQTLIISAQDISADGRAITPNTRVAPQAVSLAAAQAALEALTAQPPLALVDADPRIYLKGPGGEIALRNNCGKLFGCRLPEMNNAAVPCTTEQAIAWVTTSTAPTPGQMPEEDVGGRARAPTWRTVINSPWTLGTMLAVAIAVGYLNFADETPDDIQFLADPAAISAARKQMAGTYAISLAPGQTVMTVESGEVRIETLWEGGREPLALYTFRIGHRKSDGQLVLVTSNGAVLEAVPGASLRFDDALYKRHDPVGL